MKRCYRNRSLAYSIIRPDALYRDKNWLEEQYWQRELPISDLAQLANCGTYTILRWMKKYGIPRRSSAESTRLRYKKNPRVSLVQENYCIDCGKVISKEAARCVKCASIESAKDRKPPGQRVFHYCIDCGKEIKCKRSKRCWSCYVAYRNTEEGRREYSEIHSRPQVREKRARSVAAAHARGDFAGVCGNPSGPELAIAVYLDRCSIEYVAQYRPEDMSKVFDFYFPQLNMLLEFQGDYWHNLPGAKERDEIKSKEATTLGYAVREIWESDFNRLGVELVIKYALGEV